MRSILVAVLLAFITLGCADAFSHHQTSGGTCSRTYSTGVVNAGLQAVRDLDGAFVNCNTAAGLTGSQTNTAGVTTPPTGTTCNGGTKICDVTQAATFSNWDFASFTVEVDCTCSVTFTNSYFHPGANGVNIALFLGPNSGAPTVTLTHDLIDGTSLDPTVHADMVQINAGSTLTPTYTIFQNCSAGCIANVGTYNGSFNYFAKIGLNAGAVHTEANHCFNTCTLNSDHELFDDTGAPTPSSSTSTLFAESQTALNTFSATNDVIVGYNAAGFHWIFETSANPDGVNVTFSNNALEPGTSGSYTNNGNTCPTGSPNCTTKTITSTSFNYSTGATISL